MVSKPQQAGRQRPQREGHVFAILQGVRQEAALVVTLATTALFLAFGPGWLDKDNPSNPI
jgi:hypothetical protein